MVSWVSQTFLQLVLLSVIIVGQNVLAASADKRSEATYNDADAVLHEAVKIQDLVAQDAILERLIKGQECGGVERAGFLTLAGIGPPTSLEDHRVSGQRVRRVGHEALRLCDVRLRHHKSITERAR
jgi:hypothetical protein